MPGPSLEACENCYWWDALEDNAFGDNTFGDCRGKLPEFNNDRDRKYDTCVGIWPSTYHADWCKGFLPRDTIEETTLAQARAIIAKAEAKKKE